jgi:hypothetical protein
MVIEDPGLLMEPMTVKLAYVRDPLLDTLVLDAFQNDRTGFDGEFNTIED